MTSPSPSQPPEQEEPELHPQNPNSTQDDDNQNQQQKQSPPQSPQTQTLDPQNPEQSLLDQTQNQPQFPQTQTLETSAPQNPEQSELDQTQNQREGDEEDLQVLDQKVGHQEQEDHPEQSGMSSLSPPPRPTLIPPMTDPQNPNPPPLISPANPNRRPNKRKKGGKKKQQAIEKKIQTLTSNLKPIPFVPSKTLDFDKHEKLLKRLGLWDFVHTKFDRNIRVDLIAQLIANYDPKGRCSYVNEYRILVNRPDLARSFKLPWKKDRGNVSALSLEAVDLDFEALSEESIAFIDDFMSNWVLLHEDTWMMPNEVLNWNMAIKDGHPEKVDWAALIWFMVEKELMQGEQLEDCYYASHLQYLIKSQRDEVFWEPPKAETEMEIKEDDDCGEVKMGAFDVKEEGDVVEVKMGAFDVKDEGDVELKMGGSDVKDEGDVGELKMGGSDVKDEGDGELKMDGSDVKDEGDVGELKMGGLDVKDEVDDGEVKMVGSDVKEEDGDGEVKMVESNDFLGQESLDKVMVEEPNVELTLGQEIVEKEEVKDGNMMDVEEESKDEEQGQWLLDGGDHFLQRCNLEADRGMDVDEESKPEEEEEEDEEEVEEDDDDDEEEEEAEDDGFDLMSKGNTLEGDVLTGNLLQGMETTQIAFGLVGQLGDQSNMELLAPRTETHTTSGGPSIFGNGSKREIDHEHDIWNESLNGNNKRLRTDGMWNHKSSDFEMCVEQVQHCMGKARMMYQAKEQAFEELNMNNQFLLSELQRRDHVIEHLHKTKCEEIQKKDGEIYRLERELFVMGNLLEGYRKALKETHKSFSEYRQQCQLPEEPLYKDAGPGGVVLSTMELEKQRLKQEEEDDRLNRIMIERKMKEFEEEFVSKWEAHLNEVQKLDNRLMDFEKEVKLLKELSAKLKVSETSECAIDE